MLSESTFEGKVCKNSQITTYFFSLPQNWLHYCILATSAIWFLHPQIFPHNSSWRCWLVFRLVNFKRLHLHSWETRMSTCSHWDFASLLPAACSRMCRHVCTFPPVDLFMESGDSTEASNLSAVSDSSPFPLNGATHTSTKQSLWFDF